MIGSIRGKGRECSFRQGGEERFYCGFDIWMRFEGIEGGRYVDIQGRNILGGRNSSYKGYNVVGFCLVYFSIGRGQRVSSDSWEQRY